MPLDSTQPPTVEADDALSRRVLVEDFKRKPTLRVLATILRDRRLWPEGFVWNYEYCRSCAIGLANRLLGVNAEYFDTSLRRQIELSVGTSLSLFGANAYSPIADDKVTASNVADRIEQHLAHHV